QEFKAVSSGDIQFWKKRGEEYITWNKDMIKSNIRVTRIFLIQSGDYFRGEDPEDEKQNFDVLFKQVSLGIRVYICYEEKITANESEDRHEKRDPWKIPFETLRDYLVNKWATDNFTPRSSRLEEVQKIIHEVAEKYLNPDNPSQSVVNAPPSVRRRNNQSRWA